MRAYVQYMFLNYRLIFFVFNNFYSIFAKRNIKRNMEITKGKVIIHKEKKVIETIVDVCKIKINGEWIDGVIYTGNDRHTGNPMVFVRTLDDFNNEFEEYN